MLFPLGTTWMQPNKTGHTRTDKTSRNEHVYECMLMHTFLHDIEQSYNTHACTTMCACMTQKDTKDTKSTIMSVCIVHVYRNTFDDYKHVDLHRLEEGKNENEKNRVSNNSKGMMYSYIKRWCHILQQSELSSFPVKQSDGLPGHSRQYHTTS